MPLPVDLSTAVVTMTAEKGDGSPETGTVSFARSAVLQSPGDNLFITPYTVTATLDGSGHISVTLPVTNDADYAPSFLYTVHIVLSAWEYQFTMALTGNVDLADVIGTTPADPPSAYVLLASVGAAGGVASLDGTGNVPLSQLGNAPSGSGGTPSGTVVAQTGFGTAPAVGVSTNYSRGDHAHGTPSLATAGTTTSAVGDAAAVGSGSTAAKNDHTHGREGFGAVTAQTSFGAASANGTALTVAHSDHTHGTPAAQTAASLGLVIGTNVQAFDSDLSAIAGLTPSANDTLQFIGGAWANRTPAQVKTTLAIAESDVTNLVTDLAAKAPLASPTFTGTVTYTKSVSTPQAISVSAGHLSTNAANGNNFVSTVNANFTLDNPTNASNGQLIKWTLIQDGTGSRVMTLDTKFAFGTDITAAVLTTTANKRDVLMVQYDSTADKFYIIGFVKGY